MQKRNLLLTLFLTFAKIGFFTFGGGYAMISVISHECVEKRNWITSDDMANVTVIAESTPGPIAINCATFVGYRQAGLAGAAVATIGIVLPSFLCIWLISLFLDDFLEIPILANAFLGIRAGVGILILHAAFTMLQHMKKTTLSISIAAVSAVFMLVVDLFSLRLSTIVLMLAAGAVSFLLSVTSGRKEDLAK